MSDVEAGPRERAVPTASAETGPARSPRSVGPQREPDGSFGRALAAAREARGLSQADVAVQLRLSPRQIRAIEEEDLAGLPEGPFVRGYVRNFARLVDLPPEPLLALLNAKLKPADPLRGAGEGAGRAVSPLQRVPREPISGRLAVGAALLALVVFAVFGWWNLRSADPQAGGAAAEPSAVAAGSPAAASETPAAATPAAESGTAPPAAAVAEAPAAAAPPPAALSDTALRLTFRDRSWVEVRQADGAVLLSQINAAGTARTIDGVPPYTLVIGNASKVDLEFRGRTVDLAPGISRDDVARLRLE
ncbi:MAG: helix-turn-helix domain-containing protein [Burkholderiaceae bacterium]|nr:helix-turn-helix domain-containing protein [Burkholderiaceae bacterium]